MTDPGIAQFVGEKLPHFPEADKQSRRAPQVTVNAPGQLHCHGGDRHGPLGDLGLVPHPLGRREGGLHYRF